MKAKDIVGQFHLEKPLYYVTTTPTCLMSHKVRSTTRIVQRSTSLPHMAEGFIITTDSCRMSPVMSKGAQWQRIRAVTHSSSMYSNTMGSPDSTTWVLCVSNSLGTKWKKEGEKAAMVLPKPLCPLPSAAAPLLKELKHSAQADGMQMYKNSQITLPYALPSAWGATSSPLPFDSLL